MSEIGRAEQSSGYTPNLAELIGRVTRTMAGNSMIVDLDSADRPAVVVPTPELSRNDEVAVINAHPELHPCYPVERATPEQVREFYAHTGNSEPQQIWGELDVLLSESRSDQAKTKQPDIERRLEAIRSRLDVYYRNSRPEKPRQVCNRLRPGESLWADVAMLRATLPAFRDRLLHGGVVSRASSRKVYYNIVKDVLPYLQQTAKLAEAVVAALLAKDDPEHLACPASGREEATGYKNNRGQSYNHDLYQLPRVEDPKVPLQVKTIMETEPHGYDQSVVRVPVLEWLAPVVFGTNYLRRHPKVAEDPALFLTYLREVMTNPRRSHGMDIMLSNTAKHLRTKIAGSYARRRKQHPEAFLE